jgi:hypothetical protein
VPVTHYGIRNRFGQWWCGAERWQYAPIAARWFETFEEAEQGALRDLGDDRSAWSVKIIVPENEP